MNGAWRLDDLKVMAGDVPSGNAVPRGSVHTMATDLDALHRVDRLEVVESVRVRLAGVAAGRDIDSMIDAALDDLTPATVTTYLPILVERQVRARLDPRPPA